MTSAALLALGSGGLGAVTAILAIAKVQAATDSGSVRNSIASIAWGAVLAGAAVASTLYFAGILNLAWLAAGGAAAGTGYAGVREFQRASARNAHGR